jgi:putative two-component system response regulator
MGRPERILVADDDGSVRALLRALLDRAGYDVVEVADGDAALAAVATNGPIDLLLLDVNMPRRDGIEVTRRLRSQHSTELLPIILVTGLGALEDKVAGLDAGATDLLTKPFESPELLARIRAALRTKAAIDRLESAQGVLVALANAVEAKDPTTEHHCDRLAGLAVRLAGLAGLDAETIEAIGYGAALHDVGKIGISEAILRKPSALSESEWTEMREHPAIGERIVDPLRLGELVGPIVRAHHERWDGAGYPDRLRSEEIPLGARIVTIVDSFDAMTHDRPYRAGMSLDEALAEFNREAGHQFDPALAELFVEQQSALGATRGELTETFTRGLGLPAGVH